MAESELCVAILSNDSTF